MVLRLIYSTVADEEVGFRLTDGDEPLINLVVQKGAYNVTIKFEPPLQFVNYVFIGNYSYEVQKGWHRETYISYLSISHSNLGHNPKRIEVDLWKQLTWERRNEFAWLFDAKESGVLPTSLSQGEMRFDWLDDELYLELTMPVTPTLTCGELEGICTTLDQNIEAIAREISILSSNIESPDVSTLRLGLRSVFLCHSSKDKRFVRKLAQELKKNQIKVWLDEDDILVGDDFTAEMESGIANSDFVVVVLTPNFVERGPWAKEEYRNALVRQVQDKRVILLPIFKSDCNIPGFLASKNYADFRKNFDRGFGYLLHSIRTHKLDKR